ncbi:MAG: leucine-rich repeat protein [Bacteroidaceae bacterium]|nr:leucine-rich repeat protein [Bacteroidaceae bacterium]
MKQLYQRTLLALLTLMPTAMWAQTQFTQGDFTYTVTDEVNKTVSVKQKDGEVSGDLVIPAQVENESVTYTVTSIAASGFYNNDHITSVVFPATMRSTGASAFEECSQIQTLTLNEGLETIGEYLIWCSDNDDDANYSLGEITIPSTVTSLGKGSFYGCRFMATVNFPGSNTSSNLDINTNIYGMFYGAGGYTLNLDRNITFNDGFSIAPFRNVYIVNIGSHVTSLPEKLFYESTNLAQINMSNTVTTMGDYCFYGCTNLMDISSCLSTGMTEIPEHAFDHCTSLVSVTIPSYITTLHASAFWYLKFEDNYTQITLTIEDSPNPLTIYDSGSSGNNDMPFYDVDIIGAYIGRDIIRTAKEGNTAFATACLFNKKLTSVTFGPQVTTIGDHMFDGSTSLNLILFEEGSRLTTIGEGAFKNIEANFAFAMPNTVVTLGDQAFQNSGITELQLSDHLTTIGEYAFENCKALGSVTIPASVTKIGHYAFTNCNASLWNGDFSLTIEDSDDPIEFVCNNSWPQFCDFPNLFVYLGRNITVTGTGGITTPFYPNVKSLEIGPKVTSLPNVKNLSNLTSVKTHIVTPLAIADDAFHSDTYAGNLYIPGGTLSAYNAATGWKNFTNVQTWSFVLNFTVNGHGTMDIDGEVAGNGETKTVRKPNGDGQVNSNWTWTVTPDAGYELTSLTVEDKTEATDPAVQEIFVGNAGWENPHTEGTAINHDLDYVATFAPITYAITYDLAGGTVATANPATYNVESAAITLVNPTREGYTFAGWTGTGLDAASTTVTIPAGSTGDRTYTATWTPITYTISYDLAGGSVAGGLPASYTIESAAITLVNPTRTGYTFKGWKLDGAGEAQMTVTIAAGSTGNKAYTATWQINQYTITFDSNGGSEVPSITQDYASSVSAPAAPTKTGYTFAGWDPAVPSTIPAENMTLTAQWTINQYTITFDSNGGSTVPSITQDYASAVTAPAAPTKTGYTFAGWTPAVPSTIPAEDMTVTAKWTINQYTITFDTDGGSTVPSITQDYNTAVTAPANPTKTGYTFAGWTPALPATIPAENMTVKAQWTINTYSVSITGVGVTADNMNPEYLDDVVITIAEDPDRTLTSLKVNGEEVKEYMVSNTYTIEDVAGNVTVVATFASTKEFISLPVSSDKATFSCSQALDFTGVEGLKAYIASGFDGTTVLLTRVEKVPANTGLLLLGTPGTTYKVPYAETTAYYSNLLKPVLTATTVAQTDGAGNTNYLLGKQGDPEVIGFYKAKSEGSAVGAQKAYLQLPSGAVAAGVKSVGFYFDDTTAVEEVKAEATAPEGVFDIHGRKIPAGQKLTRGIYVINGKKVSIK